MKSNILRDIVFRLVAICLVGLGAMQPSFAGVVDTGYVVETEARQASLERMEAFLVREDVASRLVAHGVDSGVVLERIGSLSNDELLALEGQIEDQIAGGDALGVIGAVFLVLLILELVGVTDIFKAI